MRGSLLNEALQPDSQVEGRKNAGPWRETELSAFSKTKISEAVLAQRDLILSPLLINA